MFADLSPGRFIARQFRLESPLQQGPHSQTWLAYRGDQKVVVKLAPFLADLWLRLAYEREALARVTSPQIPRWLDQGRDANLLYQVLEFLPGSTLQQRLQEGWLELDEFYALANDLLELLALLHAESVLHRDLKPGNLLLGPEGRLCLLDFGLARLGPSEGAAAVGSVWYTSPEGAGLLQRDVAEASDLYSAGAVLFHCLCGRPPFLGESIGSVLRQHLSSPLPSLQQFRRGLPPGLQAPLEGLLAKDPAHRYDSARAARDALRQLRTGKSFPPVRPLGVLVRPEAVGLDGPLEQALQLLDRHQALLVTAVSGGGKTFFSEALARQPRLTGYRLVRGQGVLRSLPVSFGLLARPLYELAQQCNEHEAGQIRLAVARWCSDLVRAVPPLALLLGEAADGPGDDEAARDRTLLGLVTLFEAVASLSPPFCLLLDDVQWADQSSLELLAAWQRGASTGTLLWVLTARSQVVPVELRGFSRLDLPPLDEPQSREVLQSMAGPLPEQALAWVTDYAQGNPYLLVEALRGMVEAGSLTPTSTGWSLTGPLATSSRSVGLLQPRLQALGDCSEVLRAAAVLGRQFRLSPLVALCQRTPAEVLGALHQARRQQLLWQEADGGSWSFCHDRLREGLLELPAVELQQLHARAARVLQDDGQTRAFELVHHYASAGLAEEGRPYALRAAELAYAAKQFAEAADYYRFALQGGADLEVRQRLALALFYAGRFQQAEQVFSELLAASSEPLVRVGWLRHLSELAFSLGDQGKAVGWMHQALEELGERHWLGCSRPQMLFAVARRLLRWRPPAAPAGGSERDRLLVACLSQLAHALGHAGEVLPALFFHSVALDLAEARVGGVQLGFEWTHHSVTLSMLKGWRGSASHYGQAGLAVLRQANSDELTLLKARARTLVYRIHTQPASLLRADVEELGPQLEATGHLLEFVLNTYWTSLLEVATGRLRDLAAKASRLYQLTRSLGNRHCQILALSIWARASAEPLPAALLQRELGDCSGLDALSQLSLATAVAVSSLREGQPHTGYQQVQQVLGLTAPPSEMLLPRLAGAECLREMARRLPFRSRERHELLRRAVKLLRKACWLADFAVPVLLSQAWRELGLNYLALGQVRAGLRYLRKSLLRAERFEHHYEAAVTRLELARWQAEQGDSQADLDVQRELAGLKAMGALWHLPRPAAAQAPVLPARSDRYQRFLHWGQELTATMDDESALWKHLWQATTELLRCDDTQVLHPDRRTEWGRPLPVSASIVARALETGRAHAADQVALDESVAFRSVRSALACPVLVEGRVVRIVYLTHPHVAQLFQPEELQLTEFLCTLAGAAYQNTLAHRRIRQHEQRLRTLLETAGIGMALLSASGHILDCNRALRDLLGPCERLFPAEQPLHTFQARDLPLVTANGARIWCRCSLAPAGDLWLASVVDTTGQRLSTLQRFQSDDRRWLDRLHRRGVVARLRRLSALIDEPESRAMAQRLTREAEGMFYLALPEPSRPSVALAEYLRRFQARTGVQMVAQLCPIPEPTLAYGAFRIVQECLNNVSKYARATRVEVRLQRQQSRLLGLVRDNGCGFDTNGSRGFGLDGMAFRAELLGGALTLTSQTGAGTEVHFWLPLETPSG